MKQIHSSRTFVKKCFTCRMDQPKAAELAGIGNR